MDEPKVLYKYMSATRALEVLAEDGNGALRATQPASMNDPFECASEFGADYSGEADEADAIIEKLRLVFPEARVKEKDVKGALHRLGSQAWSHLVRGLLSRRFGIVSFSASPIHPLLWAHYADSGYGVAIGYDTSSLRDIPKEHEILGSIHYQDELPRTADYLVAEPANKLPRVMLFKSSHWQHEREWRLILELRNTVGTGKSDRTGFSINLCPIPNEAVVEVIVTERMGYKAEEALAGRLTNGRNRFQSGRPDRLVLAPDKYEYGYEDSDWIDGKLARQVVYTRPKPLAQRLIPKEVLAKMPGR